MEQQRVIIGNVWFRQFAGSEMTTLELAEEFAGRGAEVTIASFEFGGEIAELAHAAGFRLVRLPAADLRGEHFDVAWVHHAPVYYSLFLDGKIKSRLTVFSSLSHFEPLETPPIPVSRIDAFLVHSEENREFFNEHYPGLSGGLRLFPNAAPWQFWQRRTQENDRQLRSIAVVSNHPPDEVRDAAGLLSERGVAVDFYGISGRATRITPEILDRYSAVITIGKTVQYCLARGCPVFCYDHFGGPGWITPENVAGAAAKNFSGRCTPVRMSAPSLADVIIDGYPKRLGDVVELWEMASSRYRLGKNMDELLSALSKSESNLQSSTVDATVANVLARNNAAFVRQLKELHSLRDAHQILQEDHGKQRRELQTILASRSWALTAPLRRLQQFVCHIIAADD